MFPDLDVACHLNVLTPAAAPDALPGVLDALGSAGYRYAVLPPLDAKATDARRLREIFERADIAPIAMAIQVPGANVASNDPDERAAGEALLRQSLDLATRLGADQLNGVPYGLFGPPGGPTNAAALERAAAVVGRVADEAHGRGVMMNFEVVNRYETSAINTAHQAVQFVEASGSAHLGIHLDTFHMAVEEADITAAVRTALPHLRYLELGQSGRGPLATGIVDIARIVRQALDDGYEGRWGIEAFSRSILSPDAADMLAIWRTPYEAGIELMYDAMRVIHTGWAASTTQRKTGDAAAAH